MVLCPSPPGTRVDSVAGVGAGAVVLALADQNTMRRIIRGHPGLAWGLLGPVSRCAHFLQRASQSLTFGPKAEKTKKL